MLFKKKIYGTNGDDVLTGGPDDDWFVLSPGIDKLDGGGGNNTVDCSAVEGVVTYSDLNLEPVGWIDGSGPRAVIQIQGTGLFYYSELKNIDNLVGTRYDDTITGNANNNRLDGGAGNDTFKGSAGNDEIAGGEGYDILDYGSYSFALKYAGGLYADLRMGVVNKYLVAWAGGPPSNTDSVAFVEEVWGSMVADTLIGNSAANTLMGRGGDDQLQGGGGNDSIMGDNGNDIVWGGIGSDIIWGGIGNDTLYGNDDNDELYGDPGNDTLDGGTGRNSLYGGQDNDRYLVNGIDDTVIEYPNEGSDTVISSIKSYTLTPNVENLVLSGSIAITGIGNGSNNVLTGNEAANELSGQDGDDTINGGRGNDSLDGGAGSDTLDGEDDNDLLSGGKDNDVLKGGKGNDTYRFKRGDATDTIVENDATQGNTDVLQFTDVKSTQLWFSRVDKAGKADKAGSGLQISILGSTTADKVTVQDWYLGNAYHVEQIKSSDGKTLLDMKTGKGANTDLELLVQAMATFGAAPSAAINTLPHNAKNDALMTALASNWK